MAKKQRRYINREISWLSFNDRVLQEAADKTTPLIERIKFLGIFSSNLDEFFRVRVATVKRIMSAGKKAKMVLGDDPKEVLGEIQKIVIKQQEKFDEIYKKIDKELAKNRISIISEKQLSADQEEYVKTYFQQEVRPRLFPVMIDKNLQVPMLKDHSIYLAVRLLKSVDSSAAKHAQMEIPTDVISRFLVLPKHDKNIYIILLDDVIRVGIRDIFSMFGFSVFDAYTVKLTRDSELDIEEDITKSFFEKISKSLKQREKGIPVRFVYDSTITGDFLELLIRKNNLSTTVTLIPGGRYHNFKDFMNFPSIGRPDLRYEKMPPLIHRDIDSRKSLLSMIRNKDILLHFPYQSFHYVIDLLREASIDPRVVSIKITLYRLAANSNVINALINAASNGKSVTVVVELQARFDEEANIYWTNRLREEGVRIIHGVMNLKVHSKVCLITRKEKDGLVLYANIGTGNFNENTARIYSDISLFTADERITSEVNNIFEFFESNYNIGAYEHLLVSPFFLRKHLNTFIQNEIDNIRQGKEAYIIAKMNSLFDKGIIDKLYEANQAGVTIKLIVRGICSLIPGVKGMSENITVVSIVDRFLEHSRIFLFCNDGDERYYISSGDWMTRNIDRRVEVACPIYDKNIQQEIRDFLEIQFSDNTKARNITRAQNNRYKREPGKPPVHAQLDFYRYLEGKLHQQQDT